MKKRVVICLAILIVILALFAKRSATPPVPQGATLLPAEFKVEEQRLVEVLDTQDPRAAFQVLRDDMASNSKVLNSCHELLHNVGQAAFKKYKSFGAAAEYLDEMCVSGYIHGVLEGYFSSVKNIDAALKSVCGDQGAGSFKRWECYHGVGHGLMFRTGNDLPLTLQKCDLYTNASDNSACYNGAFMENFNTDQKEHFSKYLDPNQPLYPCDEETKNQGDCYMGAPIYYLGIHHNDYAGAMSMCGNATTSFQQNCYYGVGGQATRRNMEDQKFIEGLCDSSNAWRVSCIDGSTNYYLQHYVSTTKTLEMCGRFNAYDKFVCEQAVTNFFKEFTQF